MSCTRSWASPFVNYYHPLSKTLKILKNIPRIMSKNLVPVLHRESLCGSKHTRILPVRAGIVFKG